ncbi:MAG: YgfZ/GcvT domain-containing protein [Steroidobacteraceae bacterium]
MGTDWNLIELGDLGVLRVRGADSVRFLQGQVSNDVERLTLERSQLAGYHNPQGRTIALLRLVQLEPDDLLTILPRELISVVASRLAKFILRAKVKIADESGSWRVTGLVAPHVSAAAAGSSVAGASAASSDAAAPEARAMSWAAAQFEETRAKAVAAGELRSAAAQLQDTGSVVALPTACALMLPDDVHSQSRSGTTVIVRVGATPARWLVISPTGEATPLAGCVAADRDAWRLLDIADGEPQVYGATSEEFVAQMLNLDALNAIAFDKGCYTGQEVIARAHYRGRVKRRLQRFMSREPVTLATGESGQLADGRAFKVVEAVQLANGRCEFLAVTTMMGRPSVADEPVAAVESAAAGAAADGDEQGKRDGTQAEAAAPEAARSEAVLDAEALPLPYPLPA